MAPATAAAGVGPVALPDWTKIPEEILVTVMGELPIADLVRSGAVCAAWHGAYAAFRRLRLPSPRQPPCLLYSCDAFGPAAAALHWPSTGATLRVPMPEGFPLGRLFPIGSAHGWLVAADEASDLHLLNPLTGSRAALPPFTGLYNVEPGTCLDEDGHLSYRVHRVSGDASDLVPIPVAEARDCMYTQAFLSCAPSAAAVGRACVVLLLHSPPDELSYASPGDERWTWITPGEATGLRQGKFYRGAAYNERDGLFYVVRSDDSVDALDLSIMPELGHGNRPFSFRYLVHAPWGELLQVWRFRDEHESANYVKLDPYDNYANDPALELRTTELQLYRVDDGHGQRLVRLDDVAGHALFLGYNGSMCLPVADFPGLKANCAYVTEDSSEFMNYCKPNKREIGVWDIGNQRFQPLSDTLPLKFLWLNWPPPIWMTPSLL